MELSKKIAGLAGSGLTDGERLQALIQLTAQLAKQVEDLDKDNEMAQSKEDLRILTNGRFIQS